MADKLVDFAYPTAGASLRDTSAVLIDLHRVIRELGLVPGAINELIAFQSARTLAAIHFACPAIPMGTCVRCRSQGVLAQIETEEINALVCEACAHQHAQRGKRAKPIF